ncbi:MAG TPA: Imm26 family immunity protein [Hanamia sp.]
MRKKLKIKEGDIFAVPLRLGGYGIGLIARHNKGITLGYFFSKVFTSIPEDLNMSGINHWKITLIGKFSPLGIEKDEWPLLKTNFQFKCEDWPIPVLKMQDPITGQYFSVLYDESLLHEKRQKIDKEEADMLFGHGLYGYEALEKN